MDAMWIIGIVGLLFIGIGHAIAWPEPTYTIKSPEEREKQQKIAKSFKRMGGIWFVIWLLPPMFKVWITAVLS